MERHNNGSSKVKLLCSYGGMIQSRPSDHHLSYVGGDTKILAVDRTVKFSEIIAKLNSLSNRNDGSEISVKYQLPGEDLDALVSLIDDEDVEHMMIEYDRVQRISTKPTRLRIFIFDISGRAGPAAKPGANPDYLFGFDKEYQPSIGPPLDLWQIPGMIPSENYHMGPTESHVANTANTAVGQVVYRVPAVVNGRVYQTGVYPYGVTPANGGNREQPVYNFVPIMSPVSGQRMMASTRK